MTLSLDHNSRELLLSTMYREARMLTVRKSKLTGEEAAKVKEQIATCLDIIKQVLYDRVDFVTILGEWA